MDAAIQQHLDDLNKRRWRHNSRDCRIKLYTKRMDLHLSEEDHSEISAMATKMNITKSELIRTYITWGLENDSPHS